MVIFQDQTMNVHNPLGVQNMQNWGGVCFWTKLTNQGIIWKNAYLGSYTHQEN